MKAPVRSRRWTTLVATGRCVGVVMVMVAADPKLCRAQALNIGDVVHQRRELPVPSCGLTSSPEGAGRPVPALGPANAALGRIPLWPARATGPQAQINHTSDLAEMSLEDLMRLEVTAPTKTSLSQIEVPQAVTVLTRTDIQRLPAHNLPEVLRSVVGANVVRVQTSQNVLGARGSNAFTPSQILILIDGQPISPTLFSTTWWDLVPIALGDIERIEFIRSPGTIYGANAQHGVVNIITAPPDASSPTLRMSGELGQQELQQHYIGHRGSIGTLSYHASTELTRVDAYQNPRRREIIPGKLSALGEQTFNTSRRQLDLQNFAGSVRAPLLGNRFGASVGFKQIRTAQGRVPDRLCFVGLEGLVGFANAQYALKAGEATHTFSFATDLGSYEFVRNADTDALNPAAGRLTTLAFGYEAQGRVRQHHQLVAGMRYSLESAANVSGERFFVDGQVRHSPTVTAHVQDEWRLTESGRLYLGGLFSHHYVSGASMAPLVAYVHKLGEKHVLRAATFTSYRNPNVFEHSMEYDQTTGAPSKLTHLVAHRDLRSERTTSYEVGVRSLPRARLFFSADVYLNQTANAVEWSLVGIDATPIQRPRYRSENSLRHRAGGVELEVKYEPGRHWSFANNLSVITMSNRSANPAYVGADGAGPKGVGQGRYGSDYVPPYIYNAMVTFAAQPVQASLHYQYSGRHTWQWPAWNSRTGVDSFDLKPVPRYDLLNASVAWTPSPHLTLALDAYNLLDNRHTEWRGDESYFGRAVSARMRTDLSALLPRSKSK